MTGTTMRNLSRMNADRTFGYIHLSRTHGNHDIVPLNKSTIKALRLAHDQVVIQVRQLEARRIVARAFDELRLPTSGTKGKRMSRAFSEQRAIILSYKFSGLFHGFTPENLMSELRNEDKGNYAYFRKAMDLFQDKVANIRGEPWIKINLSTKPLEFISEEKVIEDLKQRCSLFPALFYGIPTIGFGMSTAIAQLNNFGDIAQMKWLFTSLSVACAIGACRKIVQHAKYTDYLKILESLPAQKPTDTI